MNREQVKEVFKVIKFAYSQFEVTPEKIDMWHRLLKDQDPAAVMKNAERFVLESKFPPTIADLREKHVEAHNQEFLKKLRQWEKDASGSKH